jgi:hypothetical protein
VVPGIGTTVPERAEVPVEKLELPLTRKLTLKLERAGIETVSV